MSTEAAENAEDTDAYSRGRIRRKEREKGTRGNWDQPTWQPVRMPLFSSASVA